MKEKYKTVIVKMVKDIITGCVGSRGVIPKGTMFEAKIVASFSKLVLQVKPNKYGESFNGWPNRDFGKKGELFWGVEYDDCIIIRNKTEKMEI